MPQEILGPAGYLPDMQANIRSISLITSTECSSTREKEKYYVEPIALTRFKQVRKFSWKCLRSPREYQILRDVLHANFNLLEELSLENGRPLTEYDAWNEGKHSLDSVLPHIQDYPRRCFPPLRNLSLSEFSFSVTNEMMTLVIDFSHLRSLTLHNCTDTPVFLRGVTASGQHVALQHLELKFQDRIDQGWGTSSLVNF